MVHAHGYRLRHCGLLALAAGALVIALVLVYLAGLLLDLALLIWAAVMAAAGAGLLMWRADAIADQELTDRLRGDPESRYRREMRP